MKGSETSTPASLGSCQGRARGTQFQAFAEDEVEDEDGNMSLCPVEILGNVRRKMVKSLAGQCESTTMKSTTVRIIKLPFQCCIL